MKNKIYIYLFILMFISLANNYYAGYYSLMYSNYFIKTFLYFIISIIILIFMKKINVDYILDKSKYLYILGNILLIYVLFKGNSINGAKAWINLGIFSFQPSEFMKIFLCFYLRDLLINYNLSKTKYVIYLFIIVLIPSILTFLEPDTGAVIIYLIIGLVFLFMKKLNKWFYIILFSLISIFLTSFFIMYFNYQDLFIDIFGISFFYRFDRLLSFINKDGYQINTALTSISNSGLFGIKNYYYFPEAATDFAFTLLIANFGIIGLIFLLIIYFLFIKNLINNKYDKFLVRPFIYILLFQYTVNILMNIGLFPIMGITLPFISYGGSSLLSYIIFLVFILNKKVSKDT